MAAGNNGNTPGGSMNNNSKQSGLSWSQPSSAKPVSTLLGSSAAAKSVNAPKPMTVAATQKGGRKSFMIFAGGLLVGGLLAWSWFSLVSDRAITATENNPTPTEEGGTTGSTNTKGNSLPGSTIGNEALVVPPTQDAGLSVAISSATVTTPTWVVVYESLNGVRGNALGAALFFPETKSRTINLLRATTPGKTYFVGRNVDNGDKQFSLANDKPVLNAAGKPVYAEFKTR